MTVFCRMASKAAALCLLVLAFIALPVAHAQPASTLQTNETEPNLRASLVAGSAAVPGETVYLALHFRPVSEEWHGYWSNPGDAGYGMELDWSLPDGWQAGEPLYPVPQRLVISGLMNHIYEGDYVVLMPVTVPETARAGTTAQVTLKAQWLACTDEICVPERGSFSISLPVGSAQVAAQGGAADPRMAEWRAAIPPQLDSEGSFQVVGETLRLAIPLPAALALEQPHVFVGQKELGDGLQPAYASVQSFSRDGDMLYATIPLTRLILPEGSDYEFTPALDRLSGILAFGDAEGVRFAAMPGPVEPRGETIASGAEADIALLPLLLAALAGGLILNVMPCVFPILSLKALSLARAGGSEAEARSEGLAYTAGVVLACVALGGLMLALRAAGEQVGWAFQLQEPWVVVSLLVLAVLITTNLGGLFELPLIPITRSGEPASAFATGLLAAVAATPCTGPFMAAALGAALLLPAPAALLLFAALGLGLALPFLLIGFVPALRDRLPRPGPWMARFRKILAIPMGLTALALVWLTSRLGGKDFALVALVLIAGLVVALAVVGRLQRHGKMAWPAFGLIAAPFVIFAAFALPASYSSASAQAEQSLLDPLAFSDEALAQARASGRPVFLWFTADWCVTCKVNEGIAIEREATRAAFEQAGVVAIRGDWTQPDAAITQFLTEQGVAGIPLYIWYSADGEQSVLPQVLTPDSLVTLAQEEAQRPAGLGAGSGGDNDQAAPPAPGSE
jgi:DsbC/DsbD-like thiol-disulfide interchange protein/cytochrome c biogenesis protein CcdA